MLQVVDEEKVHRAAHHPMNFMSIGRERQKVKYFVEI